MNEQLAGLASALADLSADQAGWAHAAARLLRSGGNRARVSIARADDDGWYLGENFAFRPARDVAAPVGADADRLAEVLGAHRDLLDSLEAATGLAAEFGDYGRLERDCAVVTLAKEGDELGEFAVWAEPPLTRPSAAPALQQVVCIAARLDLEGASALGGDDMLVLTRGPWTLADNGDQPLSHNFAFDPESGRLGPCHGGAASIPEGANMPNSDMKSGLTVPVHLRLPDTMLTAAEVERLADGGIVELGPVVEGLSVSLSVGGRSLGRGELVRLGDRFAVLLEQPAESAEDHAPTDFAEDID